MNPTQCDSIQLKSNSLYSHVTRETHLVVVFAFTIRKRNFANDVICTRAAFQIPHSGLVADVNGHAVGSIPEIRFTLVPIVPRDGITALN